MEASSESAGRAADNTGPSQVHCRPKHADALDDDAVRNIRAAHEEERGREDRDPPEDNDDECRVLAGWVHSTRVEGPGIKDL